ncbi:hypothetical protein NQ315_011877 [Exocentrus adspersus]|uniref:RRM domain-containing protein n=1 Tax=Exocentrus adspersus TaxID=1586481 RepID=A0AAV8W2R1_9CUCU|nr:hypothetical protein NQ315_011877 [Exocentrus adspersus]
MRNACLQKMAETSNVVRIVNVDSFTEEALEQFILMNCQPDGQIKKIYLRRDPALDLCYAYVVFEHSHDASKIIEILNGHINADLKKLEVELIGPNLNYRKYKAPVLVAGLEGDAAVRKIRLNRPHQLKTAGAGPSISRVDSLRRLLAKSNNSISRGTARQ